jgi:hypothetical protein
MLPLLSSKTPIVLFAEFGLWGIGPIEITFLFVVPACIAVVQAILRRHDTSYSASRVMEPLFWYGLILMAIFFILCILLGSVPLHQSPGFMFMFAILFAMYALPIGHGVYFLAFMLLRFLQRRRRLKESHGLASVEYEE